MLNTIPPTPPVLVQQGCLGHRQGKGSGVGEWKAWVSEGRGTGAAEGWGEWRVSDKGETPTEMPADAWLAAHIWPGEKQSSQLSAVAEDRYTSLTTETLTLLHASPPFLANFSLFPSLSPCFSVPPFLCFIGLTLLALLCHSLSISLVSSSKLSCSLSPDAHTHI